MIRSLTGKRIGILGMGRSGIGAARLVYRLGGTALISDIRTPDALTEELSELRDLTVEIETGAHSRIVKEKFDSVVLSPGVVPKQEFILSWEHSGVEIISEIEFASRACESEWIGVTGSNGKTTTVNLIGNILRVAGLVSEIVGNVGAAWSNFLPVSIDKRFVVEISSYQLERIKSARPRIAVILNIFENHLDRHKTLQEYAATKFRLLMNQTSEDIAILNGDDPMIASLMPQLKSRIVSFGTNSKCDWRVTDSELSWWRDGKKDFSLLASEFSLPGKHNLLNAAAAAAACVSYGISLETIHAGLTTAQPVEHRIEFVRERNGVKYFNDSKSTNLIATLTAIHATKAPIILLFGGRSKLESFAPLRDLIPAPIKKMISFGESRSKVRNEVGTSPNLIEVETVADALVVAIESASSGDSILFSPGCASFDQFKNFEERGQTFKKLVNQL